jgi:riboflavin synthase
MFSGIIESVGVIQKVQEFNHLVRIWVERPKTFNDLTIGDSVAVDGVCLTVEDFTDQQIQFALGFETLSLLKLTPPQLQQKIVNLERSLRFGDRMHGHMVSGHVEGQGTVTSKTWQGDSLVYRVRVPEELRPALWKKGSVAMHGVSLTVNDVGPDDFEVCLIPETLKQTNLKELNLGALVNIETDYMAKALFERWKFWQKENSHGV